MKTEGKDGEDFSAIVKSCSTRELIGMLVDIRNDPGPLQIVQAELKSRRSTIPQLAEAFAEITAEKLGRLVEDGLPATQEAKDVDAITERLERLRKRKTEKTGDEEVPFDFEEAQEALAAHSRELTAAHQAGKHVGASAPHCPLCEGRFSEAEVAAKTGEAADSQHDGTEAVIAALDAENGPEATQKHTPGEGAPAFLRPRAVRRGPRAKGGPIAAAQSDSNASSGREEWIEWALRFADDLDKEERFGTAVPTGTASDTWVSLSDEFASATSARLRALAAFLDGEGS